MIAKLTYWLNRLNTGTSGVDGRSVDSLSDQFYHEMAFELATVTDLNASLPEFLQPLQNHLDRVFSESKQCHLYILVNSPSNDGSFIQHACGVEPPLGMLQQLRRAFRAKQSKDAISMSLPGLQTGQLQASLLTEDDGRSVWAILFFKQKTPLNNTIRWHTEKMKDSLGKGISAWYLVQQRIGESIQAERTIHAAELHDSLAQILGYLRVKSAKLNSLCQEKQYQQLSPITEDLAVYTHSAYRQTRELITTSRLSMHGQRLPQAVADSIKEFEQRSGIVFELDNRLPHNLLSPKQALQILYIIREALSNIVRHSHATHSRVIIRNINELSLQVCIEDNGVGIDPDMTKVDSFGLRIMQERAARIKGELNITPRQKCGTRVELILALGEQQ